MTHTTNGTDPATSTAPNAGADQAFFLLRTVFTVAPIAFGLDKFFGLLTDWEDYLAPWINDLVPGTAHDAMLLVGVIEIVAGAAVAVAPRFGGLLVAAWLGGIILNLVTMGEYRAAGAQRGLPDAAVGQARWLPPQGRQRLDQYQRRQRPAGRIGMSITNGRAKPCPKVSRHARLHTLRHPGPSIRPTTPRLRVDRRDRPPRLSRGAPRGDPLRASAGCHPVSGASALHRHQVVRTV